MVRSIDVSGVSDVAEYGKVFISVKSTTGLNLNEVQKGSVGNRLGSVYCCIYYSCGC